MPSKMLRASLPAALALLTIASGCAGPVTEKPIFPPRAEIQRLQEPKPVPGPEIVTDEEASEIYNAEVEAWGDRVWASGRRLCEWFNANGADYECADPPPISPD